MTRLRELWNRLRRRSSQAPESRPKTDEEEYQEAHKRELMRNDLETARRNDYTR